MSGQGAEKDRAPHTHGGTDAPECAPYGVKCRPAESECDIRNTGAIGVRYCRTHDLTWYRKREGDTCPADASLIALEDSHA